MVLYQSVALRAYAERLIHGFSGKPVTFGGPGFPREEILANRQALCEALQIDFEKLIVPNQVHSANIKTTADPDFADTDAVIVLAPGIPVMLMFADCTPVMLYDSRQHIGAVIHAGWRGTSQSIAAKTAHTLQDVYGSRPADLIGIIGPAIGGCCYEVSAEVREAVAATVKGTPDQFTHVNPQGNPQVDLQTVNALQLRQVGLSPSRIEIIPRCTQCETDDLWSYRRSEPGRQCAVMALLPR